MTRLLLSTQSLALGLVLAGSVIGLPRAVPNLVRRAARGATVSTRANPHPAFLTTMASQKDENAILYISTKCPSSQRSWITYRHLGEPCKLETLELGLDNKKPWFLEINPMGTVPALKSGTDSIWDSLVVSEYLVEKYDKGSELMPTDLIKRARVRMLMGWVNEYVDALFNYLRAKEILDEVVKKEVFTEKLAFLEDTLTINGTGWMVGNSLTMADNVCFTFTERAKATIPAFKGWDITAENYPKLAQWYDRCKGVPSIGGTVGNPEGYQATYRKMLVL